MPCFILFNFVQFKQYAIIMGSWLVKVYSDSLIQYCLVISCKQGPIYCKPSVESGPPWPKFFAICDNLLILPSPSQLAYLHLFSHPKAQEENHLLQIIGFSK